MNTNTLVLLGVGAAALWLVTRPRAPLTPLIQPTNPIDAGNAAGYVPQPGGVTDPGDRNSWIGGVVGSLTGLTSSIISAATSSSGSYSSSGLYNGGSTFTGTDSSGYTAGTDSGYSGDDSNYFLPEGVEGPT